MSFWYHLPFGDIKRMPFPVLEAYLEHLPQLQAEMRLTWLDVVSFPHLETKARRRVLKTMERQAQPRGADETVVAPPAWLRLKGIGIDHVPNQPNIGTHSTRKKE